MSLVHKPFARGIAEQPWARPGQGDGDSAGRFSGEKEVTQRFSSWYIILLDPSGFVFPL